MQLPEIELTLKYKGTKKTDLKKINSSKDAAEVLRLIFNADTIEYTEEFIMLCLNQANKVIAFYKVSSGGQTATVADIRVIATIALNSAATNVIIAHNHPSGNTTPSAADKAVTNKIKEGLAILEIKLLEHIILTDESYFSFADEGII